MYLELFNTLYITSTLSIKEKGRNLWTVGD